jgi:hypothetical protein
MKLFFALLLCSSIAYSQVITDIVVEAPIAQSNIPLTFGQVFKEGDVPQDYTIALEYGTRAFSTQFDVKALHADGSVRHAIISAVLPFIPKGATRIVLRKYRK